MLVLPFANGQVCKRLGTVERLFWFAVCLSVSLSVVSIIDVGWVQAVLHDDDSTHWSRRLTQEFLTE